MKLSILLCLTTLVANCAPANIVGIFPFPSKSHWILGSALLKELAKRGHDVTMISPFPLKNPPERYEDVHLRGLNIIKETMSDMMKENQSTYDVIVKNVNMITTLLRDAVGHEDLHAFIKEGKKVDLVIQISVFMNEALLGVGHALNATTIGFSLIGSTPFLNYVTGNPAPYAYVPNVPTHFTDEMNFIQRVINTVSYIVSDLAACWIALPYQQRLLTEFFPNAPPLQELIDNVDLTLVNSHIVTETPRPYLPNIIQIGGYHLYEIEKLPVDVEKFLNGSKHGVVYFSLGSNAKSSLLPKHIQNEIFEAFKSVKYDVLWVHDGELPSKPKNIMATSWVPQRAVLAHDKVKVFITHSGLGSTVESVYFGVPMICIPLFGDQHKNAVDSVAQGYALSIKKDDITKALLVESINEIMGNSSYSETIALKSDIYRNQEMNPMDKAVFWVEHVLKHKGAKHLKAKAVYLPTYQYLLLDVVAFLVLVLTAVIIVSYYIMRLLYRVCCGRRRKLKTN